MLDNLVIAVESESQVIDIGRVSGFMQKVRQTLGLFFFSRSFLCADSWSDSTVGSQRCDITASRTNLHLTLSSLRFYYFLFACAAFVSSPLAIITLFTLHWDILGRENLEVAIVGPRREERSVARKINRHHLSAISGQCA